MFSILAINTTTGLGSAGSQAGYVITQTPADLVAMIVGIVLSILGVIFLLLILYGGFIWMTSMGNAKNVEKAKNILIQATVGLVITVSAYAISYYVIGSIGASVVGAGA